VCFALIALVGLAQWLTVGDELADVAVLIALYWVARSGSLRALLLAGTVAETGAVAAAIRWAPSQSLRIWVGLSGLVVAATVLGITVRQQRALLVSLKARAATLEFERDQEGRLAAAAERARIAREMHDIVSHNLTVMTALADAATYTLATDPAAHRCPRLKGSLPRAAARWWRCAACSACSATSRAHSRWNHSQRWPARRTDHPRRSRRNSCDGRDRR
jgi:signal transduction histidine kinase